MGFVLRILAALRGRIAAFIVSRWGQFLSFLLVSYLDQVISWVQQILETDDVKQMVLSMLNEWLVEQARERMGLELNSSDPMSAASFTQALSAKVGFPLTDITSQDAIRQDIGKFVAGLLNTHLGTQLDNLYPLETLRERVGNEVVVAINSGLSGAVSMLSAVQIEQVRGEMKRLDLDPTPLPPKVERARALHRIAQRKYAKRMDRLYIWYPRGSTPPVEHVSP